MNTNELENLKAEMERSHKANIATIERMLSKERAVTGPLTEKRGPRLGTIIEEIIKSYSGKFDINDICREYENQTDKWASENVRREISNCINKWKHRNPSEISEVEQGKGRRSGVYKFKTV